MRCHPTLILCSLTLLAGLAIGSHVESWSFTEPVEAHAQNASNIDQLYQELAVERSALFNGGQHLAKIASVTTPSVVHIQSRQTVGRQFMEETGSGVLMTSPKAEGVFVVTNRHVIRGAPLNSISVHLSDGRIVNPERVWNDKATDIAVLKMPITDVQTGRWGDSDEVEIGHIVLAMGSPFGLSQSVTLGIISAKGRRALQLGHGAEVINQDFLQTDAAINPGNSGGPLIDMSGRVIGINTAIASNSGGNEGIGFSIPSNLARLVFEQLLEHGEVQRAYLGVKLDPDFDLTKAKRLKLTRVRGARIVEVYSNTPASRANLQRDDVILTFNGAPVLDENHLINLVSLTPVNRKVTLELLRNGRKIVIEVVLRDREELERRSS